MEGLQDKDLSKLTVLELRAELCKQGLSSKGIKSFLIRRLKKALAENVALKQEKDVTEPDKTKSNQDLKGSSSTIVPNCYNSQFQKQRGHAYAGSLFTSEIYEALYNNPVKQELPMNDPDDINNVKEEPDSVPEEPVSVPEEPVSVPEENLFEEKMDVKTEEFSGEEEIIKMESPDSPDSIDVKPGLVCPDNNEPGISQYLQQTVSDNGEVGEETTSSNCAEKASTETLVDFLTVSDEEDDDIVVVREIEEIDLDDVSEEESEEIDEAMETELLRGDTPALNNAENSKAADEAFDGEKAPDNKESETSNEPTEHVEEIVIPDSPGPPSVEEVQPQPQPQIQITVHENNEVNSESPKSPSDVGNPVRPVQESPKPASDRNQKSSTPNDDDRNSFIRLDDDDSDSVIQLQDNEMIHTYDTQSRSARRSNSVGDTNMWLQSLDRNYEVRPHRRFTNRRKSIPPKDSHYDDKIRKDLEERHNKELKRKEEWLRAQERKQRYEAERLEREREKILREKELAKKETELMKKELEWEKQRIQREQEELRMEQLKFKNKSQEESFRFRDSGLPDRDYSSGINLGYNNNSNNFNYGNRRDFHVNSAKRYENSASNSYNNETRRDSPPPNFFSRPFHSTNQANESLFAQPDTFRNFFHGPLSGRGRGVQSVCCVPNRNTFIRPSDKNYGDQNASTFNRYESSSSRCKSRGRESRSRSRSRSGSRDRDYSRSRRSRSRSRPNFSRSRSKSRHRSRSRSRSRERLRSVQLIDLSEQDSFNPGSQGDQWVSDDETDRYGNPRSYGRRHNNTRNFGSGGRSRYDNQDEFEMPSASVVGVNYSQPERNNFDTRSMINVRGNFGNRAPFTRNNSNFSSRGNRPAGRCNPTFNRRNFSGTTTRRFGEQENDNQRNFNGNFHSRGMSRNLNNGKSDGRSYWK